MSHSKLITKLIAKLGNGPIIDWIRDYLSDRHQFVHYNGHSSDTVKVLSGVPQGSVLAPLLFLLFIDDIVETVNVKIRLFADDCMIYSEIKGIGDQVALNISLNSVAQWCREWQMVVNSEKTVVMNISRKKNKLLFPYSLDGVTLRTATQYKYLGVLISSDLKWTAHVHQVTKKAMNKLFFLKRTLRYATTDTKRLSYITFIRPMLEYANIVWFPSTNTDIAMLENVQRKAVRFIFNRFKRTDSPSELLRQAELSTLRDRAKVHRLKFFNQLLNGHFKTNASAFAVIKEKGKVRQKHDLMFKEYFCNNNTFRFSFFPRVIREWNALDSVTVAQPTLQKFLESIENLASVLSSPMC